MKSIFFFKKKIFNLHKIYPNSKKNFIINHIRPLQLAKKNDLTFFDSINYKTNAEKTLAGACITTDKLSKYLPDNVEKIIVSNVLYELAKNLKL